MLKRLLKDLLNRPFLLMVALLLSIIQVALSTYLPLLIGDAIDQVLRVETRGFLISILFKMLVVIALNTVIQWLVPLIYNQLIFKYTAWIRQSVIEKIHCLPLSYLDKLGIGDMVSRVTTDVEQLTNGLLLIFNQFFLGILTILVSFFTMAKLDLAMSMFVLLLTPVSVIVARFIAKKTYHLSQLQTQSRGKQTQLVEELIRQSNLVQLFNAQEQGIQSFKNHNQIYTQHSLGAIFYSSIVNPSTRLLNAIIYALLTLIGSLRLMQGSLSIGQLVTFLNFVVQYTKPFNEVTSVLSELQGALACAERLYGILDVVDMKQHKGLEIELNRVEGRVQFEAVDFSYHPEKPLLKQISLDIPPGSKVAIVGPTGAGKSTLINLLMQFYDVDNGRILLDGTPIIDYNLESFRNQFGMVLQETWLKQATIHDNIAYANPKASREEVIAAAKAANADFFISQLSHGYDTFLADSGNELSQGQRQLLTIARLFLKLPQVLILDEATSSIDTKTELLVQEAFEKLMEGRTSFIIAHRLSTIRNADIILVMVDGNIIEHGNHPDLMNRKGFYYQMQQTQE